MDELRNAIIFRNDTVTAGQWTNWITVYIQRAGEALFSLGWQSPRVGVSIKILGRKPTNPTHDHDEHKEK